MSYSNHTKAVYHYLVYILLKVALFELSDDNEGRRNTIWAPAWENQLLYLPWKSGVVGLIWGFSSLSDDTLSRGPITIFQDKLFTGTYYEEAEDYFVPCPLSWLIGYINGPPTYHAFKESRNTDYVYLHYLLLFKWAASWEHQRFAYAKTKTQISFAEQRSWSVALFSLLG